MQYWKQPTPVICIICRIAQTSRWVNLRYQCWNHFVLFQYVSFSYLIFQIISLIGLLGFQDSRFRFGHGLGQPQVGGSVDLIHGCCWFFQKMLIRHSCAVSWREDCTEWGRCWCSIGQKHSWLFGLRTCILHFFNLLEGRVVGLRPWIGKWRTMVAFPQTF